MDNLKLSQWWISGDNRLTIVGRVGGQRVTVAQVNPTGEMPPGEDNALAALISEAPRLLELALWASPKCTNMTRARDGELRLTCLHRQDSYCHACLIQIIVNKIERAKADGLKAAEKARAVQP